MLEEKHVRRNQITLFEAGRWDREVSSSSDSLGGKGPVGKILVYLAKEYFGNSHYFVWRFK